MHVLAPASSANLGSGFDALGIALDLPFELADSKPVGDGFLLAEPTHPAAAAYIRGGGSPDVSLWWRSPIPPGRGLGFSGAAHVAGAALATAGSRTAATWRAEVFTLASELEGHPDNAAASCFGGVTVAVATSAGPPVAAEVAVHPSLDRLHLVVWSPRTSTATGASRRRMPSEVALQSAVASIGRSALWVAALGGGRTDLLRTASEDQLHQPRRLLAAPESASVLAMLLDETAVLAAWLSGSGPSVAAMVSNDDTATAVAGRLRAESAELSESAVRVCRIDRLDVQVLAD